MITRLQESWDMRAYRESSTFIWTVMWVCWDSCGWGAESAANLNIVYTMTLQLSLSRSTNQKSSLVSNFFLVLHKGSSISGSNIVRERAALSTSLGSHSSSEIFTMHYGNSIKNDRPGDNAPKCVTPGVTANGHSISHIHFHPLSSSFIQFYPFHQLSSTFI